MKKSILFIILLSFGCSSLKLVNNWKDPDTVLFHANKVLIVGMIQNDRVREDFENKLKYGFTKRNIEAVRSLDLFDVEFTSSEQSEKELYEVEQQLLNKDFDAILFTRIMGSENKKTLRSRMSNFERYSGAFKDEYMKNQGTYYEDDLNDNFTVFHAETALYCICVDKERQVIWRTEIDITNPKNIEKSVEEYINLVLNAMENQDLIFHKANADLSTGL
ncbi:hypothetical protein LCGC14_2204380 [marine sediment metagenome]|uniref:Cardiolipin synthetase n=1 Tax=marine sediment metagenome TaxID=412755 RepID=A0A0F9E325_9ZZZZ